MKSTVSTPELKVFSAPLRRRVKPALHLADLTADAVVEQVVAAGLPKFRADQLLRHYYQHARAELTGVSDLATATADLLQQRLLPTLMQRVSSQTSDARTTLKTAWRMTDGALAESVLMRYPDRTTVCVSSQAGCGMACPFCATGQQGLTRNLSTAEIVEQVRHAIVSCRDGSLAASGPAPTRLSNIVFMGMGEPLANYAAVLRAVRRITAATPYGFGMSARSLTISTVGLVPGIRRLASEGLPVRLAVSLHAPDDALRDTLVPVNTRWPVAEVLDAAWFFQHCTGRRVSIEYAMMHQINDQQVRAHLLGELLRGHRVHVNLIPLNPTPGSRWTASDPQVEQEFQRTLESYGLPVTVRDTRGRQIDAACGQLAGHMQQEGG